MHSNKSWVPKSTESATDTPVEVAPIIPERARNFETEWEGLEAQERRQEAARKAYFASQPKDVAKHKKLNNGGKRNENSGRERRSKGKGRTTQVYPNDRRKARAWPKTQKKNGATASGSDTEEVESSCSDGEKEEQSWASEVSDADSKQSKSDGGAKTQERRGGRKSPDNSAKNKSRSARSRHGQKVTGSSAMTAAFHDMESQTAALRDTARMLDKQTKEESIKEQKLAAAAAEKAAEKEQKEAERRAAAVERDATRKQINYHYYEDEPYSRLWLKTLPIAFALFTLTFTLASGPRHDDSHSGFVLSVLKKMLGFTGLGPLVTVLSTILTVIDWLDLETSIVFSLWNALYFSFLLDFTYCCIVGKRHFTFGRTCHNYKYLCTSLTSHPNVDLRPDSNARGDLKHKEADYFLYTYTKSVGPLYFRCEQREASYEVLAQLTGPRIMNLATTDEVVVEKLTSAAGALDSVNHSKYYVGEGVNLVSNTSQLAYGFYRHFRRDAVKLPFGKAPLNH